MKSCGPQRARAVTGTVCAKKNPDEISLLPTRTRTNNDPRYQVPYVSVTLRYPVPTRCPVKATSGDICALHRRLSLFLANNAQSIWSRHDVVFACVSLSDLTRTQKAKKVIRVPFLAPAVGFETFVPSTIISSIAGNVVSSGGSEEGGAATRNRKRRNRRNRSRKKAEENEVAPEEDSHDVEQSKSRSQSFTENANMTYQNSPNGVNSSHPKVSKDALQSVELQKATKQWFSEIDADDRAVALGFVDGPIFSVFSKLALSSSKPSPIPNPNAGEPTTDKPKSKGQYKFYVHVPLNLERSSCFLRRNQFFFFVAKNLWVVVAVLNFSHKPIRYTFVFPFVDYFIDWEAKVSFKDVEKLLREEMGLSDSVSRQNGVSSEYKQETTDSSINYPVESLAKGGGSAATEAEQYVEDVESDAFRIRGSDESATTTVTMKSEGGEEESGGENGKNTQESKKAAIPSISSENTKSPLARKVSDLMEKVCVIFPSAFNLVSSDAVQDFHPFITLQPSYLRSINGEDLLFTFDEIMPTLASNSSTFLPDQLSNSSWIDAVRNYCDETLSIPLYMLLLLRFRNSVSHAFHKSASLNDGSARSENGDEEKKESSQSDSAPSKELYDVNGSLESAESHSIPTANGESKAADSHIWLLRSLLSRLSTMNSVESEKLGEISSPLLSYIPQLSQENHLLEDVLIIRLSTLTQCLKDVGPRIDEELRRINEAIHEVVQRASVDLPLGEAKQGKVLNTDVGSLATTTWNLDEKSGESFDGQFELQTTSSAASQSPTGKKNSKKKKKKKVRTITAVNGIFGFGKY